MLTQAKNVQEVIENILKNTSLQVSVKVRLGVKENTDFEKLIPMLNSLPLKNICIHPRRAMDFYEGKIDTKKFADCCKKIKHEIIYSGDIFCVEDFARLKKRFPFITHWMLGRGILQNPFLPSQIRGINYEQKIILTDFVKEIESEFVKTLSSPNEKLILGKMKEFSKYLCKGFHIEATPFLHSSSLQEINKEIEKLSEVEI